MLNSDARITSGARSSLLPLLANHVTTLSSLVPPLLDCDWLPHGAPRRSGPMAWPLPRRTRSECQGTALAVSLGLLNAKHNNPKPPQHGTMSKKKKEWKAEKERLLSLGLEERRKEYGGNYVTLEKIATWRRHGKSTAPEEEEDHPVSLCDKVSLYKGDITILEVDAIVNAGMPSLRNTRIAANVQDWLLA
ncbi:hypothetical protein AOLI_G00016290 [Acnodon oligacanthus]